GPAGDHQPVEPPALKRRGGALLQRLQVGGIEGGEAGSHRDGRFGSAFIVAQSPWRPKRGAQAYWLPGAFTQARSWRSCSSSWPMKRKPIQCWPGALASSLHNRWAPISSGATRPLAPSSGKRNWYSASLTSGRLASSSIPDSDRL